MPVTDFVLIVSHYRKNGDIQSVFTCYIFIANTINSQMKGQQLCFPLVMMVSRGDLFFESLMNSVKSRKYLYVSKLTMQ